MTRTELQLPAIADPRLAALATSARGAWLWSFDGRQLLWANPAGARLFGAGNGTALLEKPLGPADPHRRQVAQIAHRVPVGGGTRLERLRGFGARFGTLATCACTWLDFPDGDHGLLIQALEPPSRALPLEARLRALVDGEAAPAAVFTHEGDLVAANDAAQPLLAFRDLAEAGFGIARDEALSEGRAAIALEAGPMQLYRVGGGAESGLVGVITPHPTPALDAPPPPEQDAIAVPPTTPREAPRRHPLRFAWRMDRDGRFALGSDEFTRLIGARTAVGFGRPWHEIVEAFGLDAGDLMSRAIATRERFGGITLYWPVDGGGRLRVELSGSPLHDENGAFAGYCGFGVCRDLDSLDHLAELRRLERSDDDEPPAQSLAADFVRAGPERLTAEPTPAIDAAPLPIAEPPASPTADQASPLVPSDAAVETPMNVVPFRPAGDAKLPTLTPVENNAFNELARQLSERLDREQAAAPEPAIGDAAPQPFTEPPPMPEPPRELPAATPDWLAPAAPPARGEARRDRMLLDLLPTGVLIYRLDRLLYANPAFLQRIGHDSLQSLEEAGGLDALYVEAGVSPASSLSDAGTPVTIAAGADAPATAARLFTISWDGESALALMFASPSGAPAMEVATATPPISAPPVAIAPPPLPETGQADAEDLAAILDTTAEGIVMFDAAGRIHTCNRGAEALFGYDGDDLVRRHLADLFAPESERAVSDYFEAVKGAGVASLLDHGRDVLGRVASGGIIPLAMTMGRTRPEGPNFFAVFRDLAPGPKSDEVQEARRPAERAAATDFDVLGRIDHEIRTPLTAIVGFADAIIAERFGALGDERYGELLKDIRASGERVIAVINDLCELSRIETGKIDLAFTSQNLNEMVESCVAVMQPQANRERIIIRTSLASALPPVTADASALRQITMNLIGNSIHLAHPAGQVIVSTAVSDRGEVVLRVRDTGTGVNGVDTAEPPRTPSDQGAEGAAVNLSLTRALVEANRAQFNLKSAPRGGTLVEVVFSHAAART